MLYPSIGLGPPDVTTPRDSTGVGDHGATIRGGDHGATIRGG